MQVQKQILPLQVAIKYYEKWDCDIECQVENSIYYKFLAGEGNVQFLNGNTYHGNFMNGLMHGKGLYKWKHGLAYQGEFTDNCITGEGKLSWPDGSYYFGSIEDGKRDGFGEYYCASDKSTYKGKWVKGLKQGKGLLTFVNGSLYEGQFKEGLRSGFGKMRYGSGNEYEGSWLLDKKEGKGAMNWFTSCQKYQGEWRKDLPCGLGSYYWYQNKNDFKNIKSIYKGQWRSGKRQGFGTLYYNNGCRLQGNFSNNTKEGICYIIDEYGDGKLQHYTNDKSTSKKQEIAKKQQKFHIKLPEITPHRKESVLQNNEPAENNYSRYVDFQNDLIDDSINNLLLRENSQLRHWYKSIIGSINKEVFTGLNMEGLWRLIKDMKLTDDNITIAKLNRSFFKGNKSRYDVDFMNKRKLEFIKKHKNLLTQENYNSIQWSAFVQQAKGVNLNCKTWEFQQTRSINIEKISLNKELDLHDANHTILFRHFIAYLLHLAILVYENQKTNNQHLSFRKCLEDLFASIKQTTNGPLTLKTQKNCSEILTNVSHSLTKINIPQEYLNLNKQLFKTLNKQRQNLLNTRDETVTVKQIYCLLKRCNILKEAAEKMLFLEKLQRKLNVKCSFLKKENKVHYVAFEKILLKSSQFGHILNYEMIEQQFDDMIYLILNRKIGNSNSKEDFIKKYKELIQIMITQVNKNTEEVRQQIKSIPFNLKRYSEKDRLKDELLKKMEEERLLKIQKETKERELVMEEKERRRMGKDDVDIKDEEQQDYEEQYYD